MSKENIIGEIATHSIGDIITALGIEDKVVNDWFVEQIAGLAVQSDGDWWVDKLYEQGVVSIMNKKYMMGAYFDGDKPTMLYVVNFENRMKSSLIRDGRGWVRKDKEGLGSGKVLSAS